MAKVFDVAELGEITVFRPDDGEPSKTRFRARIVERSGLELSLEFGPSESQMLYEALTALRLQYPSSAGLQ